VAEKSDVTQVSPLAAFEVRPIGVIRTPFDEKVKAPRQAVAAPGVEGRIELLPGMGFEDALEDLTEWDHLWVIFLFHLNTGWKPKVLPPRSTEKRGVFATRAPHRPNPIGISVVRLESVDGLVVHVRDVDMVDGSPVLDIKPYVPYADSIPTASSGWLEAPDPEPAYDVAFSARAIEQLEYLESRGIALREPLRDALKLGPEPHAYRRIRVGENGISTIAMKSWRARFECKDKALRQIVVLSIHSGYSKREIKSGESAELEVHRAYDARWPNDA
jgi:tRNA-Thr(GGU) m(6)t(6)A37 methyltransferase TsaA